MTGITGWCEDGPTTTFRVGSRGAELLMGDLLAVGPQGSIRVDDYMGNDQKVARVARISYGREFGRTAEQDERLIRKLISLRHTSPLEMCRIQMFIRLPIFVARQWVRHRQASLNEISYRYVTPDRARDFPDQADFYIPDLESLAGPPPKGANKQGRDKTTGEKFRGGEKVIEMITAFQEEAHKLYYRLQRGGDDHDPLASELARIVLPVGTMTKWSWACDLHNLFHFLTLRLAPDAQEEIRNYALVVSWIARRWVPVCWEAWANGLPWRDDVPLYREPDILERAHEGADD